MSASSHGGAESQLDLETVAFGEDPTVPSTSGGDSARFALVDDGKLVEARVSDENDVFRALKIENEGAVICDVSGGDNLQSSLISSGQYNALKKTDLKKTDSGNVKSEHKKVKSAPDDYDSMLSEFDQFASKRPSEAVGYGYEIADILWGKVKSHPWWPGRIYNEAFASPSVQRSKREEGHVLVAFFGDSSYGWFDPSELVPFEDNFAEKSRESSSRSFQKALQEAVDELSRRRSLGLLCRCRNKFNFWPSSVKGYFAVDVGEVEPVVYSTGQINKARESFHPNEMLSFVMQLALTPMTHQHWTLEFIKNKATVLACRKALFEEFDETYAQAFGSVISTPRPSAPVAMDPSKVPLSGRLVIAESLGKRKVSVKPTKSKDQLEKDKYMFKRRDEPTPKKTKKAGPLLVDGPRLSGIPLDSVMKGNMHQISVSDINDGLVQPMNHAYVINDIKPSQGSMKHVEAGMTKPKLHKQRAGELSTENATPVAKKRKKEISMGENVIPVEKMKKRKKEIKSEASADAANLPLSNSDSGASLEKVSGILLDVPPITSNNQPDNQKNDDLLVSSYPLETKQAVNHGRVELAVLVKDLCALAVNAFHGMERDCIATTRVVVLKYRSLVFQKSLVSSPPTESETTEANPRTATDEKSTMKPVRPLGRPDDPTKGGKKRVLSDSPESIKKKNSKLGDLEETNKRKKLEDNTRKKLIDSEDVKKKNKKLDESKQLSLEKKIPQRPSQSLIPPKVVKVEPSKRTEHPGKTRNPTMLVMKFPAGANLPSGAHLRAKFARFGPLDLAATRVFWKTYTCRLVFHQKVHAETALKFAQESGDLFGNVNVRYYIREVGESAESEATKAGQKEEPSASRVVKIGVQQAHQQQLKSCLKKGSGEEVGNGNGNGNGRGTSRVKFILGGEGSSKSEQVSSYSMDVGPSKKLPKIVAHSNVSPLPFPSNVVFSAQQIPPKNDISQQLLNLLTRCNDVVNNLTGVLGYVPYHPL